MPNSFITSFRRRSGRLQAPRASEIRESVGGPRSETGPSHAVRAPRTPRTHAPSGIGLATAVLIAAGFSGRSVAADTPRSFRLREFAQDLYSPTKQAVLQVVGDSINCTYVPERMQAGYRDRLNIPFNGWVVHADNGNSDIGFTNAQGSPVIDVVRLPGDSFIGAPAGVCPVRGRESVWSPNPGVGAVLAQSAIATWNLTNTLKGDPFYAGYDLDARLLVLNTSNLVAGFEVRAQRGFTPLDSTTFTAPPGADHQILSVPMSFPPSTGFPSMMIVADAQTASSPLGHNAVTVLGTRFRAPARVGVQMQFLSFGGWRTSDHLDPAKFSDQALAGYYRATDPPTHILLWLGQNLTALESSRLAVNDPSVYRDNLRAVMDRHNAVIASLGAPPPRWLLVSQYKTGYDESYHLLIAQAQYELAQSDPHVSAINLYLLAGGESFDRDAYLSDGVHPNAAGVQHLATLLNAEMESTFACRSDITGDGFITGDDYDAFVDLFFAGSPVADFTQDGFVTGDDFDAFVDAFLAGC